MKEIKICGTEKGKVEYVLEGSGPVVLIFHGGHGSCFSECKQQVLINNGFSVLLPSRPGYGGTPIESGKNVEATAALFAALLKKLGIEKVSVIGISAGGPAALVFAEKYPELTEKLVLESAVVRTWFSKLSIQYYAVKVMFNPRRQKKFWSRLKYGLEKNEKKILADNLKLFTKLDPSYILSKLSEREIQSLKEYMVTKNDSGNGFVADVDHRAGDIGKISCPVLIIHSKNDGCLPFSHAEYAHDKIVNSELFVSPAESHFIYVGSGSKETLEKRVSFLSGRTVVL